MATSDEERLVGRLVRTRDLTEAVRRGVDASWFSDPGCREVFTFLRDHFSEYGEVPSARTVKDNYPTFRLLDVPDTVEYLIDRVAQRRRQTKVYDIVRGAVDLLDGGDFERVVDTMRGGLADLDSSLPTETDLDLVDTPVSRFDAYASLKGRPGGLLGVGTGFPTIDQATAGLQPGQLVTIIASPKTGKSVLALRVAQHVHSQGYAPMFQSYEMSNIEQQQRFDALIARISHNRLRRGLLTESEENRYYQALKELEGRPPFILTDSAVGATVSGLAAKISMHEPDIVFIDGVYLMIDELTGEANSPQALTNITRALKRMAQRLDIPVVITTQTLLWKMRGTKVSENSIGWSSSFLQDSDVIIGLERVEDEDDVRNLKIVASRNCGSVEAPLLWDWESGVFEELGSTDIPEAEDEDAFEYGASA